MQNPFWILLAFIVYNWFLLWKDWNDKEIRQIWNQRDLNFGVYTVRGVKHYSLLTFQHEPLVTLQERQWSRTCVPPNPWHYRRRCCENDKKTHSLCWIQLHFLSSPHLWEFSWQQYPIVCDMLPQVTQRSPTWNQTKWFQTFQNMPRLGFVHSSHAHLTELMQRGWCVWNDQSLRTTPRTSRNHVTIVCSWI